MISACALLSVVRGPLQEHCIVSQLRPTPTHAMDQGQRTASAGAMPATGQVQRTTARQGRRDPSNGQRTTDNWQRTNNKGHRPARAGAKRSTDHGQRTRDTGPPGPDQEKWRSVAGLAARWRLEATGEHRRKVWQLGTLRFTDRRMRARRNGALTLAKAPFSATFRPFFADFLRVFR
jgi:hypothetical protein